MTYIGYALSILLMGGAAGALYLGVGAEICVPTGAAGVALMLAIETQAWWRRGLSPDRMEAICGCLALLCGVPIYYFPDKTAVLVAGFGGFVVLIFLGFAAQIWGKARDTRTVFTDWRIHARTRSRIMAAELGYYHAVQRGRMLWL